MYSVYCPVQHYDRGWNGSDGETAVLSLINLGGPNRVQIFMPLPTMAAIVTLDWPCGRQGAARHGSPTRSVWPVRSWEKAAQRSEPCWPAFASSHCPSAALALITYSAPHRKCHSVPLNAALMFIATEAFCHTPPPLPLYSFHFVSQSVALQKLWNKRRKKE